MLPESLPHVSAGGCRAAATSRACIVLGQLYVVSWRAPRCGGGGIVSVIRFRASCPRRRSSGLDVHTWLASISRQPRARRLARRQRRRRAPCTCSPSSRNMDQARQGCECSLDGLLPAQRSSDYYTANSYITPGPGAPTADCGRDRPQLHILHSLASLLHFPPVASLLHHTHTHTPIPAPLIYPSSGREHASQPRTGATALLGILTTAAPLYPTAGIALPTFGPTNSADSSSSSTSLPSP